MKNRSGYILLWKCLLTDPRFGRLVSALERSWPEGQDLPWEFFETLALGCLSKTWLRADDHIHDDDRLELSADEVDELLGIKLVSQVLGPNYLEVLDAHNVRLPNYTAHNGILARKQAQGAARQQRHRARDNGNAAGNAPALHGALPPIPSHPIPAPPIPTPPNPEREVRAPAARAATASRLPTDFELTEARRAYAVRQGVKDPAKEFERFRDHFTAKAGADARKHDWDACWRNWCRRAPEMSAPRGQRGFDDDQVTWRPTK